MKRTGWASQNNLGNLIRGSRIRTNPRAAFSIKYRRKSFDTLLSMDTPSHIVGNINLIPGIALAKATCRLLNHPNCLPIYEKGGASNLLANRPCLTLSTPLVLAFLLSCFSALLPLLSAGYLPSALRVPVAALCHLTENRVQDPTVAVVPHFDRGIDAGNCLELGHLRAVGCACPHGDQLVRLEIGGEA